MIILLLLFFDLSIRAQIEYNETYRFSLYPLVV